MTNCQVCNGEGATSYPVQEVLTMHIRGLQERRVQALGEQLAVPLCDRCLDGYIAGILAPKQALTKAALGFGALLLIGVALLLLTGPGRALDLRFPGALMVGFAVLGFWQKRGKILAAANIARDSTPAQRRERFLSDYLLTVLPTKSGENDITYIPLTPGLKDEKPAALVQRYGLLPAIALQLNDRLNDRPERVPQAP